MTRFQVLMGGNRDRVPDSLGTERTCFLAGPRPRTSLSVILKSPFPNVVGGHSEELRSWVCDEESLRWATERFFRLRPRMGAFSKDCPCHRRPGTTGSRRRAPVRTRGAPVNSCLIRLVRSTHGSAPPPPAILWMLSARPGETLTGAFMRTLIRTCLLLAGSLALATSPLAADEGMWMPSQIPDLAPRLEQMGFHGDAVVVRRPHRPAHGSHRLARGLHRLVRLPRRAHRHQPPLRRRGAPVQLHPRAQPPPGRLPREDARGRGLERSRVPGLGHRVLHERHRRRSPATSTLASTTSSATSSSSGGSRSGRRRARRTVCAARSRPSSRAWSTTSWPSSRSPTCAWSTPPPRASATSAARPTTGAGPATPATGRSSGPTWAPTAIRRPSRRSNVPYRPEHWLKVQPDGVDDGDCVFVVGYPGKDPAALHLRGGEDDRRLDLPQRHPPLRGADRHPRGARHRRRGPGDQGVGPPPRPPQLPHQPPGDARGPGRRRDPGPEGEGARRSSRSGSPPTPSGRRSTGTSCPPSPRWRRRPSPPASGTRSWSSCFPRSATACVTSRASFVSLRPHRPPPRRGRGPRRTSTASAACRSGTGAGSWRSRSGCSAPSTRGSTAPSCAGPSCGRRRFPPSSASRRSTSAVGLTPGMAEADSRPAIDAWLDKAYAGDEDGRRGVPALAVRR